MPSTRSQVIELREHTAAQFFVALALSVAAAYCLLLFGFMPVMDNFFSTFLKSDVLRGGEQVIYRIAENRNPDTLTTGTFTTWALVPAGGATDAHGIPHAEYIFKPVVALTPLVLVGGTVLAMLFTVILPASIGFARQKIEREILMMVDRLAVHRYGDHTADDVRRLTSDIVRADGRRLHDLADTYGMPFTDLDLLRKALLWRDAGAALQLLRLHDAVKFYMREYFTDRYSNAILGLVYIGAAVLIIVIGIRGLKFLPATDPSVVLGSLGLEFMLLITYAVILMYGRSEESSPMTTATTDAGTTLDANTEQLLRAFLATSRTEKEPNA